MQVPSQWGHSYAQKPNPESPNRIHLRAHVLHRATFAAASWADAPHGCLGGSCVRPGSRQEAAQTWGAAARTERRTRGSATPADAAIGSVRQSVRQPLQPLQLTAPAFMQHGTGRVSDVTGVPQPSHLRAPAVPVHHLPRARRRQRAALNKARKVAANGAAEPVLRHTWRAAPASASALPRRRSPAPARLLCAASCQRLPVASCKARTLTLPGMSSPTPAASPTAAPPPRIS